METRYASHPDEVKTLNTTQLREKFLIESVFVTDDITLVYTHVDRFIVGGAYPVNGTLKLEAEKKEMGAEHFLERREIGIINIGGKGSIVVDGTTYSMDSKDCLYIGRGAKDVSFASESAQAPAKFYFNSTPAHKEYPTVKAAISEANPRHIGSPATSNERTIYQYIHENGIKSSQLVMGLTMLKPNNMWNTMPTHTHNRRSEMYFYFDIADNVVFHLMGEPTETRHIVIKNEQAVISPSWSIHSGVGTSNYTFIWGMGGENQAFDDMDAVPMLDLK
ncbi:MAG: 5-dehydro-4-deoxy-D-glucuronate isomerase [Gorillibacterium sp.]|nr:5-dehydro-4-deoxy-D-glucuronate isomerase [Gorillibacterium sp.]